MFLLLIILSIISYVYAGCNVNVSYIGNQNLVTDPYISVEFGIESAFAENTVQLITPVVELKPLHAITNDLQTFTGADIGAGGGSATVDNRNLIKVSTDGTGLGVVRSKATMLYNAGEGARAMYSAAFDPNPVAGTSQTSVQFAGPTLVTDYLNMGYIGTDFGCHYGSFGQVNIYKLTFNTVCNGDVNVTVGTTTYSIPLGGVSTSRNAYDAAVQLNNKVPGHNFYSTGTNVVVAYSTSVTATTGFSFNPLASGGTGTAETLQTATPIEVQSVLEANFITNISPWFNKTSLNVYMITWGYLGAANIRFYVYNPDTVKWDSICKFDTASVQIRPNFRNPSFKIGWSVLNLVNTQDVTIYGASAQLARYRGFTNVVLPARSETATKSGITTQVPVLSIRVRTITNGFLSNGQVRITNMGGSTDSTKGAVFRLFKNCVFDDSGTKPIWTYENEVNSIVEFDTTAGAGACGTFEQRIFTETIGGGGSFTVSLIDSNIVLAVNDTVTITAEVTAGTGSAMTAVLNWVEDR